MGNHTDGNPPGYGEGEQGCRLHLDGQCPHARIAVDLLRRLSVWCVRRPD